MGNGGSKEIKGGNVVITSQISFTGHFHKLVFIGQDSQDTYGDEARTRGRREEGAQTEGRPRTMSLEHERWAEGRG